MTVLAVGFPDGVLIGCSYGMPLRQERSPTHLVHLERRVEELENRLRKSLTSSVRADSDSTEQLLGDSQSFEKRGRQVAQTTLSADGLSLYEQQNPVHDIAQAAENTLQAYLPCSDRGRIRACRGPSSSLDMLCRVVTMCGELTGIDYGIAECQASRLTAAFENSPALDQSAQVPRNHRTFLNLPPKDQLSRCVDIALEKACPLLQFISRSTIDSATESVYNFQVGPDNKEVQRSFALLYILVALGKRFEARTTNPPCMQRSSQGLVPL